MNKPTDFIQQTLREIANSLSPVKNVIIVLSGKGGVGKSFVSAALATTLWLSGRRVALLDADFHGPSIPWILGVENGRILADENSRLVPFEARDGLAVLSPELMLDERENPIIWRGPMKARAILELLSKTRWGERDYMVVDLPPGTGDEPLTIAQYLARVKSSGALLVLTPSSMVRHIVVKAKRFCEHLNIPLLGGVMNMAYFRCPNCGKVIRIFGEEQATELEILAEIPLDPELSRAIDSSKLIDYLESENEVSQIFKKLAQYIEKKMGAESGATEGEDKS